MKISKCICVVSVFAALASLLYIFSIRKIRRDAAPVILSDSLVSLTLSLEGKGDAKNDIVRMLYFYWLTRNELTSDQMERCDLNVKFTLKKYTLNAEMDEYLNDPLKLIPLKNTIKTDEDLMAAVNYAQGFDLRQLNLHNFDKYEQSIVEFQHWLHTKNW